MGVQSFKFPIDFLNNLEKPTIYIARKDKEFVGSVSVYDNLSLTFNLNAFNAASFTIYRDVDGKKQDYFDKFEEEMLIMIPGISWYQIHVETNITNAGITKSITANSLEVTLCDKRLVDFQVNSDDFEDDDYVITKFYNPTEPKKSLLNRVLNVSPVWTVGHVDQSLCDIQRTFDESDTDVYSFLTGAVSEAFNCLFIFDTFNCTVNAYDLDNYGIYTNIFVSMDNLAQNMTQTIDENSIFTCYRITGGDDIQIAEVNPNGTNKIYNFEYYLPYMSIELQNKIKSYNAKYQELKPKYEDIVLRMSDQIYIIQELNTKYPDSLASTDWTQYGLSGLATYKKSYETQDQLFCAQGMNKPTSLNYNLYTQNLENLNAVTAEYNKRVSEIESATSVYEDILAEMKALQSELDMDKWFTEDEWKTLDSYVIEQTYTNDNFGAVNNTTESELFDMEKELYDIAWKDLSKKCRPQYQYTSTLTNILTIPEFKDFVKYFELGNFIQMKTDYDTVIRLRIISFTVDYNNTQNIAVTFSDAIRVYEFYDDTGSIQAQVNSAAMSFQFNKDQYDKTVREGNFVAEMRKYGLDVATTQIYNATDQSQTWDSTGMTFRKWNDERQDYDPEMIKIINNMMVFLDGDGARMAIGKISLPNGNSCYGINCELLVNKLTMSENVWIENNSGTYKFDDAGFSASNGTNTIKIQPQNSGEIFSIYKGNKKNFYVDASGNLHFEGDLTGATGRFSGELSGGSINLGNNTFTVDKNGNMYASSCNISGNISSSTITGTDISASAISGTNITGGTITGTSITGNTISGGTISGATISGNTISGGTISGTTITGGSINIGTGFSVDSSGNMKSVSGEFSNAIFTNTITYGLNYNGRMYYYPIINVPNQGYITFGVSTAHTTFPGSVQFDNSCIINNSLYFSNNAYTTSRGGNIYKCNGDLGNDGIASCGWVKGYVSDVMPSIDTSNFVTSSQLSGYMNSLYQSTTGGNAVTNLSYAGGTLRFAKGQTFQVASSSDKRLKYDFSDINDVEKFYMLLNPQNYRFKTSDTDDKVHTGLIAQELIESLTTCGLDYKDYNIIEEYEPRDFTDEGKYSNGEKLYRINYENLHGYHIAFAQDLYREIDSLKQEIEKLKETIKK